MSELHVYRLYLTNGSLERPPKFIYMFDFFMNFYPVKNPLLSLFFAKFLWKTVDMT